MLLQHTVKFHEARDWIRLQDPATLTYQSLLNHCKSLEQWCMQFQKVQQKGRAELTTITATSVNNSSIQVDSTTTHPNQTTCHWCGYSHLRNNCPAIGEKCHNCNSIGHFSALCRTRTHRYDHRQSRHYQRRPNNCRWSSRSSSRNSSASTSRGRHSKSPRRCHTCSLHGSPHHTIDLGEAPHHMHTRSVLLHMQLQNLLKHQARTLMTRQQKPTNVRTDAPPPSQQTLHLPIGQWIRGPIHSHMQWTIIDRQGFSHHFNISTRGWRTL